MRKISLTIPCYQEAERLDGEQVLRVLEDPRVELVLVDDGSRDGTLQLLKRLAERVPERVVVLPLAVNQGKAEAVRQGMLLGLERGADAVGFFDADLSTPPAEIARLVAELQNSEASVVLGSRVRLLGRRVERQAARHYLGRLFASVASFALRLPVYDTQCGAKVFRDTPALRSALGRGFGSRWVFDVELLGRLLRPREPGVVALSPKDFKEVPLVEWIHRAGSKLTLRGMARAGVELAVLTRELRGRRR